MTLLLAVLLATSLQVCGVNADGQVVTIPVYTREQLQPEWDQLIRHREGQRLLQLRAAEQARRDGTTETLMQRLTRDSRSIDIPVRMSGGAPGRRRCTGDFKIKVISRWLREHGATADNPATVAVGISTDEWHRINNRRVGPAEKPAYPLIGLGLDRAACMRLIADAGLPVPPKSSCWFCPFKRPQEWREMRRDRPDLFDRACDLEALLNRRRDKLGKDHVYLTGFGKPLGDAVAEAQDRLDGFDGMCDEGYCFV